MSAALARRSAGRVDLDSLRERVSVADVLRHLGVSVSRDAGRVACVLHDGGNPQAFSFAGQVWNCFGACGRGGDVFKLAELAFHCDLPRAVAIVASIGGVDIAGEARLDRAEQARQ